MKIFHTKIGRLNFGLWIWEDYPIRSLLFHPFKFVYGVDFTTKKLFQFILVWNFERYGKEANQEVNK